MGVRPPFAAAAAVASAALFVSGCGSTKPDVREGTGEPPTEVTATCMPDNGIAVSTEVVAASAEGVHLRVIDNSGRSSTYLHYGWKGQYVGGDAARYQLPVDLAAPPNAEVQLNCSPSADLEVAEVTLVHVVDPHGFWSPPERPQDAGCEVDGVFYPRPPSKGPTEHAALEAMIAENWIDETFTFEIHRLVGGYHRADGGYRFVERRNGFTTGTGWVGQADGVWSAQIDASCAERLGPPFDPMATLDGEQDTLQIICSPDGAVVEPATVRVAPDGVRTNIVNRTGEENLFLVYQGEADDKPEALDITTHDLSRISWWRPGRERVGCTDNPTAADAHSAEIQLIDPDRDWRRPTLRDDCAAYIGQSDNPPVAGRTEEDAITSLLKQYDFATTPPARLYDGGYWRLPGHSFVVQGAAAGDPGWIEGVTEPARAGSWRGTVDGAWTATVTGICRPS